MDEPDAEVLRYLQQIDAKMDRIDESLRSLNESGVAKRERVSDGERLDRLRRFKAIRDMTPKGVVQTDSVILLREDRDR